jgi:hypothetical protein
MRLFRRVLHRQHARDTVKAMGRHHAADDYEEDPEDPDEADMDSE